MKHAESDRKYKHALSALTASLALTLDALSKSERVRGSAGALVNAQEVRLASAETGQYAWFRSASSVSARLAIDGFFNK